ncbi:sensor histidine kinase [Peribacillus sp. SCS-155]|uniref:sensor histidine kinase n=1 Tax=Peribacillus sedimenti TaxID=3115297 RepID=UPI003905FE12
MFSENPAFSINTALWLSGFVFIMLTVSAAYFAIRNAYVLKGRLNNISTFIGTLRNGRYAGKLSYDKDDEISRIMYEINLLADHIQKQVHSMQRLAEEKANLSQQAQAAAVMEERQRIARDLHDAVSQQLFALNMMAAGAVKMFDLSPEKARQQLTEIADISVRAQGEMRALLLHLRPVQLQEDSLCDGLIKLLKELKQKTSLQFVASIDEVTGLPKSAEEHLFRIVQEAISNIIRHADAQRVKVELTGENEYIRLYISDDGKGFDPLNDKMVSYGIKMMKERCEEIGGIFQLRSKLKEGTYIDIKVPLKGVG